MSNTIRTIPIIHNNHIILKLLIPKVVLCLISPIETIRKPIVIARLVTLRDGVLLGLGRQWRGLGTFLLQTLLD